MFVEFLYPAIDLPKQPDERCRPVPYRSKCAKCDNNAALNWSIFNGETAIVAPLCVEHGQWLTDLVELVGPRPQPATGPMERAAVRKPKVTPLDWTPPA
jgi:hypothetical protein